MMEIDKNAMLKLLDTCYDKALIGLPTSESVYNLADEYCCKYTDPKVAAQKMCNVQVIKCGTSGFITGLGGLITLPVAIPANVASVIYVQLRMIATVAKIGGYVRDKILGKANKDIDIEIHNIKPEELREVLDNFGRVQTQGASFGVYTIHD